MVLPSEFQPTFRSRFPASAETGFHQLRGTLGPGCIRGSPLGAHFRTDRPALPGLMSGSASAGVAVRASSPDQGAFRRRFVSALAAQETCISGTSSAATNRSRFERLSQAFPTAPLQELPQPIFPVGSTVIGISADE